MRGHHLSALILFFATAFGETLASSAETQPQAVGTSTPDTIVIATYNVSFYRKKFGQLAEELQAGSEQATKIAAAIRLANPDAILLNEIDDDQGKSAKVFVEKYLNANLPLASNGETSIKPWSYIYTPSVNTGVDSEMDLDGNERLHTAADAWGYGEYPGQYGMAVISRYPILTEEVRTFQKFLWRDMPDATRPKLVDGATYWSDATWAKLRLSSKTHADVPIEFPGKVIHLLISHPTPPVFDGPEDRNGSRNHDEIRFWTDYVSAADDDSASGNDDRDYHVDDSNVRGKIKKVKGSKSFVILGDLNADPMDGSGIQSGIKDLIASPQVNGEEAPKSDGAVAAAKLQGKLNANHRGDPASDTGDFNDGNPGNLRCDFVLPSKDLSILDSAVLWPSETSQAEFLEATDHRLVWVRVKPN